VQRSYKENEIGEVTEMSIVDIFTKLIFGDDGYSERESLIIDAFRSVHPDVMRDSYQEMGEYLRNLGVREMIQLVSRVRQYISDSDELDGLPGGQSTPDTKTRPSRQGRSTH
jgi:hypothetical protein